MSTTAPSISAAPPAVLTWGVVVFPGTNCDQDTYHVLEQVLGQKVRYVWHRDEELSDLDVLVLPGGFAHGDYLRAGAVARFSPIMDSVREFARSGKAVLGICNGFQVLLEAGLLPGAMLRNRTQNFACKWTYLRVESTQTPFLRECRVGEVLRIPIAHGEGNYFAEPEVLESMRACGQILLRYCDANGAVTPEVNPNGSLENIAGVCNAEGNVMGLMPHPERASEAVLGTADGRRLFESVIHTIAGRSRA